jgi:hypothetical protein
MFIKHCTETLGHHRPDLEEEYHWVQTTGLIRKETKGINCAVIFKLVRSHRYSVSAQRGR